MLTARQQLSVRSLHSCLIASIEDQLLPLHPGYQHAKVYPGKKHELKLASGARITIPANSIRGEAGELLQQKVDFFIIENSSLEEMILSNRPAASNGDLMNCSWQLKIRASLHSMPLQLVKPIEIDVPLKYPPGKTHPFKLYTGSKSSVRVWGAKLQFDWKSCPQIPFFQTREKDQHYLNFRLPSFDWYALGRTSALRTQRSMLTVKVKGHQKPMEQMNAYLLYPDLNAISYLYRNGTDFSAIGVPSKQKLMVMVIAKQKGQLYFGARFRQNNKEKILDVSLSSVSPSGLLTTIREHIQRGAFF